MTYLSIDKNSRGKLLILQCILVIIGILFTLYTIYILINSIIPYNALPFIILLSSYLFIVYYALWGYKKDIWTYKIAIYLYMATLLVSFIPLIVNINIIEGLIEIVPFILMVYFLMNIENFDIAKKVINLIVILMIIVTVIIFMVYLTKSWDRALIGVSSLFLVSTLALIYNVDDTFKK